MDYIDINDSKNIVHKMKELYKLCIYDSILTPSSKGFLIGTVTTKILNHLTNLTTIVESDLRVDKGGFFEEVYGTCYTAEQLENKTDCLNKVASLEKIYLNEELYGALIQKYLLSIDNLETATAKRSEHINVDKNTGYTKK